MADQKFCINCGGLNPPEAKFCATCGAAFGSTAAPPPDAAPLGSPPTWQPPSSPPPEPERRFKGSETKLILLAVLVIIAIFLLASSAFSSPPVSTSTATPPATTPTATPSASLSSPPPLTQDQLNTFENSMVRDGYTVTQHLVANGTGADGSLYYTGQLAKAGITYDYYIIDCKDSATADSHFSSSVSHLHELGFSGSYNSEATVWSGTAIYNGVLVGGGVTEAADRAPYLVITDFGGFSSTPTPDYSSYFTAGFANGNSIVQPFTKSTNGRGDDVYTGITRNPSGSYTMTTVVELTQSQAEAKHLYDQTVAQRQSEGFVLRSDWVAQMRATNPNVAELWDGQHSSTGLECRVQYEYDSHIASWVFVTEAQG